MAVWSNGWLHQGSWCLLDDWPLQGWPHSVNAVFDHLLTPHVDLSLKLVWP